MGLIKTALKTAVAVKTAHFVHDRIQQRQQESWAGPANPQGQAAAYPTGQAHPTGQAYPPGQAYPAGQAQAYPPAPAQAYPAGPVPADPRVQMPDNLAMLTHLGELRASGVLTEAEFEAQKARILAT